MRTNYFLLITAFCFYNSSVFAQEILPDFTIKNNKGNISVSWQNKYLKEVKGIIIQRSFDSSRNFSSIFTVTTPADSVSSFLNLKSPYPKAFYRLFIVLDSGVYFFTGSKRPVIDSAFAIGNVIKKTKEEHIIKLKSVKESIKVNKEIVSHEKKDEKRKKIKKKKKEKELATIPKKEKIIFPTTAAAGPDQIACSTSNITLAGNMPLIGKGLWTYISGPNTPSITTPSSPTTTVMGLLPGVYIFRWSISNDISLSSFDQVQITISAEVTPANAGPAQSKLVTMVKMQANTPTVGTGNWTKISGPNTPIITTPNSPTTTITGMIAGVYIFRWIISNGYCDASSSNIKVSITTFPSNRIYTDKDNNLIINLPDFKVNNYIVKFYSEKNKFIFGLNKINENLLTIEKVNFLHAGWFFFEIYENGEFLEKNKFFIPKD